MNFSGLHNPVLTGFSLLKDFHQAHPISAISEKSKLSSAIWPKQCEASPKPRNFCVYILEGLCNGYVGRSSLESVVLLHMGVKTEGPMGLLEARPRACGRTD